MKPPLLAIVVPCYNEALALPRTLPVLLKELDLLVADGLCSPESYILCVDDGSSDHTWQTIKELHQTDSRIKGISLAHNRGHQNALIAGMVRAREGADAVITIDADLQDDPRAMREMMERYAEGCDVVYGVRADRRSDPLFKRITAHGFYRLQERMGAEVVYDHGDYRLLSRRALEMLRDYDERNVYLRGVIPMLGLPSSEVHYSRGERVAGKSKYPLRRMLALSIDGITSFSARPMRIIFMTGVVLLLLDILVFTYVLISYFGRHVVMGWASIMMSLWFLGSLILIALGIIGEYIGKIFTEVKGRPLYAIREEIF